MMMLSEKAVSRWPDLEMSPMRPRTICSAPAGSGASRTERISSTVTIGALPIDREVRSLKPRMSRKATYRLAYDAKLLLLFPLPNAQLHRRPQPALRQPKLDSDHPA